MIVNRLWVSYKPSNNPLNAPKIAAYPGPKIPAASTHGRVVNSMRAGDVTAELREDSRAALPVKMRTPINQVANGVKTARIKKISQVRNL